MDFFNKVHEALSWADIQMQEKGYASDAYLIDATIKANERIVIACWYSAGAFWHSEGAERIILPFEAEGVNAALEAFTEKMVKVPDLHDAKKAKALKDLGHLIDNFREIGVDVAFLNPLEVAMKALSENILTHRKDAA